MKVYKVRRYLLEEFEVEAEDDWTRERILDEAEDPYLVRVLRHSITPRPPREDSRNAR